MIAPIQRPELSFVIPVVERHGDLSQLYREYSAQTRLLGRSAEFIFVVDFREREVVPELRQLQASHPREVILVLLGGSFGESALLTVGIEQARGEIIVTLAAYFQVEPEALGEALDLLGRKADLVVGRRHPRTDSLFNRLQSRLFHWLVGALTRTGFRDISCGFRVMRRSVAAHLTIYGGLHRFIPLLALQRGFRVHELSARQRQEDRPTRYFGIALYLKRLLDILTVFFLIKFTQRPLRFFGLLGALLALPGIGITGYLGIYRLLHLGPIAHRPLLLLGVLLIVLGIQTLSIGLIGEIIIFTHARKMREYQIAEIVQGEARAKATTRPLSGIATDLGDRRHVR